MVQEPELETPLLFCSFCVHSEPGVCSRTVGTGTGDRNETGALHMEEKKNKDGLMSSTYQETVSQFFAEGRVFRSSPSPFRSAEFEDEGVCLHL